MKKKNEISPRLNNANFMLWKILDHTCFMIARSREKELARFGLTPEQAHVLDILSAKGDTITINEIVAITQRQHHSISTLITRMSRQGLLKKVKNDKDSRRWDVMISPKGKRLFQQMTTESINEIYSGLPLEARAGLVQGLGLLLNKAYEVLGQPMETHVYIDELASLNDSLDTDK